MSVQRARNLRKRATEPERILWSKLRHLKHHGLHFRRQVPIGKYVVDFACHSAKLVIEVDGSRHDEMNARQYDAERTQSLNREGYRVLRYWNAEVMRNSTGIAEAIVQLARETRYPHPKSLRDFDLPTRGR